MEELNKVITIEDLVDKFKTYNTNKQDLELINKAFD